MDLSQILQDVHEKSLKENSNTSWTVNLDWAYPFLEKEGLHDHIVVHEPRGRDIRYVNSEQNIYHLSNLMLRNLDVDLELNWSVGKDFLSLASRCWSKWHFENCRFHSPSPDMNSLIFDWYGSFRFYRNIFDFGDSRTMRAWTLAFANGSDVLFHNNDFNNSSMQVCHSSSKKESENQELVWDGIRAILVKDNSFYEYMIRKKYSLPDSAYLRMPHWGRRSFGLHSLAFLGNKGINKLELRCYAANYEFRGINHINHLRFEELETDLRHRADFDIYLGAREKIDLEYDNPLHHRRLFVTLREIASSRQDTRLVNTLEKQIDRIEYFLTREHRVSILTDVKGCVEYWQDRFLYEWRRWSSDFYRSWIRPLVLFVAGYVVFNAFPFIWIEQFTALDWLSFSLRPINRMPFYAAELQEMYRAEYQSLPPGSKIWLRLTGFLQLIWIAMWGFAFSRAVKR